MITGSIECSLFVGESLGGGRYATGDGGRGAGLDFLRAERTLVRDGGSFTVSRREGE